MKALIKFHTIEEVNAYYNSGDIFIPNVCILEGDPHVEYNLGESGGDPVEVN